MDFQASARSLKLSEQNQTLILLGVFLTASLSITYAALTIKGDSTADLRSLQDMGRLWVAGDYHHTLRFNFYPPATVVLLAPLSLSSFETLSLIWFFLNLVATGLSVYLAVKLIGPNWPWRAQYFLLFFALSWAPFRVTMRNGQTTMIIIALLLGSLMAWRRNKNVLSGILLGLALCKYTLTFPFIFYFIWQRQWRVILVAAGIQLALTWAFAYRLGISLMDAIVDYYTSVKQLSAASPGAADLNSILLGLTGGHQFLSIGLGVSVVILALVAMFMVIRRRPESQNSHFALLALLALWPVYHRTYDFMLCLIPVAVLINFLVNRRLVVFSCAWLTGFSLLALGLPGLVTTRMNLEGGSQALTTLSFLLLHSERLLVLLAFWSLLWVLWKRRDGEPEGSPATATVVR
ncbi:MAG TPA: glycosyltransferase family 87 protein [Pyrinomonadaceae bacterium]|nr:glycosyltransferase family 87 protein [Pyrinomonadaceae bacterium]